MMNFRRRSVMQATAASVIAAAIPIRSRAQNATYTADDLKSTLTPLGGLRAGNADGSIPAWTGGYTTVPAGYGSGTPRPNFFPDDKVLLSINSTNFSQYQDKLPAGVAALMQRYPDYRIDVYVTRRTASAPQYVYDYTYKNASNAQLAPDGNSISNAYGGLPFPIPQNGHEVMWNHLLAWRSQTVLYASESHEITSSGDVIFETRSTNWFQFPYYFENGEADYQGFYSQAYIDPTAPPFEAGSSIVTLSPTNPIVTPVESWTYLQGERRVRRAPELQYDTPNSLAGGTTNWDEVNVFSGKLDRYDLLLVGTKEMYVPYNCNAAWSATVEQQFMPHFLNPDLVRWELHRVRVVEMTVKQGARDVDAKRIVYFDEDTGEALYSDVYDANGGLWKFLQSVPALLPDIPCHGTNNFFMNYDLQGRTYESGNHFSATALPQYKPIARLPNTFFSSNQLVTQAGAY
jgi:hypothetical protein